MDLEKEFPMQVYINLGVEENRRRDAMNMFLDAGLPNVVRFPAIRKKWIKDYRGHWDAGRYALSLTQKLVLRAAKLCRAPAVLIFEDDVVMPPNLPELLENIELPEDWGLFYLGCQHMDAPEWVAPGLVRVREALDLHAVAVRADYYETVMRVLTVSTGPGARSKRVLPSDREIAKLHASIPSYACYPNLGWQRQAKSSLGINWWNDNYAGDGLQRKWLDVLPHLWKPGVGAHPRPMTWSPVNPNLGLGDRLRGMAGMAAFAAASGRELVIYWPPTEACNGTLAEVATVPGVRAIADWQEFLLHCGESPDFYFQSNLTPEAFYQTLRKGEYLRRVTWEKFHTKWRQVLQTMRPSPAVEEQLRKAGWEANNENPPAWLGLHIRRTDALTGSQNTYRGLTKEHVPLLDAALLPELDSQWSKGKYEAVVLACDDEATAISWQAWLSERSIPTVFLPKEWNATGLRQTSLTEAAADLFLLSKCQRILASVGGSFSWMAAEMGGVPVQVVLPDPVEASRLPLAVPSSSDETELEPPKPTKELKPLKIPDKVQKDPVLELEKKRTVAQMLQDGAKEMEMIMLMHQWRAQMTEEGETLRQRVSEPIEHVISAKERRFVALCVPCGNRLEHLKATLPNTLECTQSSGNAVVVVAEFACRQGTAAWVRATFQQEIAAGHLVTVKITGESKFRAGRAKAVAHAVGCHYADYLLNLDADNHFSVADLNELEITASRHQHFIAQQQLRTWDCFGRLFLPTSVYKKCGGYHASLGHYGFDDRGLIRNAVAMTGAAFLPIALHSPPPVAHDHQTRTEAFPGHEEGLSHEEHIEKARLEFEADPFAPLEAIEAELTDSKGTRMVRLRFDGLLEDTLLV